ncbi:MAG: lysophospholipid acyltransferase family protein [Bacteroidales bacterium]|nr:lysophospholipid acyltransferase family protein [Bacteroidales bacterium]
MIKDLKYWLIYSIMVLPALLPMRVLFLFSDLLYPLVYHVVGYRKKVVRRNLVNSFPEKSIQEIIAIEKKFYRHFCDFLVESIKQAHISKEEILMRTELKNPEFLDKWKENGRSIILMTGHYANWEWFASLNYRIAPIRLAGIYRQLKNAEMERFFLNIRKSYGAIPIEKEKTLRELIKLRKEKVQIMVAFVSDQTPSYHNIHYWSNFLNQETAMFSGAERIAKMVDYDVVYMDVTRVARGKYMAEFKLISENPKETPEFEITEKYTRMMEETIIREPQYWLWTHKRWKHKRK